ncbi:MAG: hypothetical protein E7456_02985 [Ruminococcaceae bacterium]|nr:hypothetical protein [Oscillospiraceae bacterium]
MEHLLELTAVVTVCGTFLLLIWLLKSLLVTPVPTDRDTELYMVVTAKGDAQGLEQTLQSLQWIREEGRIPMTLVVCDCGMGDEGKRLVSAEKWDAIYCTPDGLGDITWQKGRNESEAQ